MTVNSFTRRIIERCPSTLPARLASHRQNSGTMSRPGPKMQPPQPRRPGAVGVPPSSLAGADPARRSALAGRRALLAGPRWSRGGTPLRRTSWRLGVAPQRRRVQRCGRHRLRERRFEVASEHPNNTHLARAPGFTTNRSSRGANSFVAGGTGGVCRCGGGLAGMASVSSHPPEAPAEPSATARATTSTCPLPSLTVSRMKASNTRYAPGSAVQVTVTWSALELLSSLSTVQLLCWLSSARRAGASCCLRLRLNRMRARWMGNSCCRRGSASPRAWCLALRCGSTAKWTARSARSSTPAG